jgi:hypothetical protein
MLTAQQISDLIGIPAQTLSSWRCAHVGFPYYKLGDGKQSTVRYSPKEVADYMAKNHIYSSTEASAIAGAAQSLKRRRFSAEQIEKLLKAEKGAPETHIPEGRRLLTQAQVSEWIGIPITTLGNWRSVGSGPVYIKLGDGQNAPVRYDAKDIEKYLVEHRRLPIVPESFHGSTRRAGVRQTRDRQEVEKETAHPRVRKQVKQGKDSKP